MFYRRIGALGFVFVVYAQAEFMDIYLPAGENMACQKQISHLIEKAQGHYPSITASQKMLLAAEAQKEGAKWNYFPTPSVNLSGRSGYSGTTVALDQPLWTGGKLDAMSDLASARADEAHYALNESSYVLTNQTLAVLQKYIQADGEIKSFEDGKKQLNELAQMLTRRVEAGVSSESDQELLNARIAQIEADIFNAKANMMMTKSQLEILVGAPMQCAIGFTGDRFLKIDKPLETLIDDMLDTHPSLKRKEALVDAARADQKSADAAIMPNISLRAEHQKGSVFENLNDQDNTVAYVSLSFSPGAGLSSLSNIESAKYKTLQSMEEKKAQEQALKDLLVVDYANYTYSTGRIDSIKNAIRASQKVLDSYARLFLAGKRQWLDLVNTSREVTQYKIALASLRAMRIVTAYRLALQTGKIPYKRGLK